MRRGASPQDAPDQVRRRPFGGSQVTSARGSAASSRAYAAEAHRRVAQIARTIASEAAGTLTEPVMGAGYERCSFREHIRELLVVEAVPALTLEDLTK